MNTKKTDGRKIITVNKQARFSYAIEDKYGIPIIGSDDMEQILSIILSEAIELEDTID